jgi:tetratricopeptide (TPR) repeat protein
MKAVAVNEIAALRNLMTKIRRKTEKTPGLKAQMDGTAFDALRGRSFKFMNEKNLQQVTPECAKLYQTGLAAAERHEPNAAIPDFLLALDVEPGFVDCRRALRRAAEDADSQTHGLPRKFAEFVRYSPVLTWAGIVWHFKPLRAVALLERVLAGSPGNLAAHRLMAKAARAANLPRTAVLSLETLPSGGRGTTLQLANALVSTGDASGAAMLYGRLLKDNPDDTEVLRALKKQTGRIINAAPEPRASEVFVAKQGETDDEIIRRFEAMVVHCPKNAAIHQHLAEAYARKNRFDNALASYRRALQIGGGHSPAIKKAIAGTTLRQIDDEIKALDPAAPGYASRREQLQNRRLEFQWREMNAVN